MGKNRYHYDKNGNYKGYSSDKPPGFPDYGIDETFFNWGIYLFVLLIMGFFVFIAWLSLGMQGAIFISIISLGVFVALLCSD